jgi:hypothetical protein
MDTNQVNEFIVKNADKEYAWLAEKTGVSVDGIRKRYQKLGLGNKRVNSQVIKTVDPAMQLQLDMEKMKLSYTEKHTDGKYKLALKQIESLTKENEVILGVKDSVNTFKITPTLSTGSEATAVWLASDWHVAEKVTRGQTNGINEYNLEIAKQRGEQYFKNGLSLTKMMGRDVEIKTILLALLGDFITGHLHSQAVETNYLAPAEEMRFAQSIIASGIEYVLKNSKYNLKIVCQSGNHGRTTRFAEFGSENGHSWEFIMYCNLKDYFRNEKRVEIVISEGAHTYVDIYGKKIRFLHGHDIKYSGGVGGIFIGANKAVAQWDIACPAYLTCFGHFHQMNATSRFVSNGSLIGYNAFALSIKASAEAPAQQMFLIDKKRGKTVVAPILFDI